MSRSIYKPNFVHRSLFSESLKKRKKNISLKKLFNNKKTPYYLHFFTKNSLIPRSLIDKKISIYSGSTFITLYVLYQLLGYKLGSFCITRKKPAHKGKQKQRKKVSRINIGDQRKAAVAKSQMKAKTKEKK